MEAWLDDGDTVCHPILVPSYLQEFDDATAKVGKNLVERLIVFNMCAFPVLGYFGIHFRT